MGEFKDFKDVKKLHAYRLPQYLPHKNNSKDIFIRMSYNRNAEEQQINRTFDP